MIILHYLLVCLVVSVTMLFLGRRKEEKKAALCSAEQVVVPPFEPTPIKEILWNDLLISCSDLRDSLIHDIPGRYNVEPILKLIFKITTKYESVDEDDIQRLDRMVNMLLWKLKYDGVSVKNIVRFEKKCETAFLKYERMLMK